QTTHWVNVALALIITPSAAHTTIRKLTDTTLKAVHCTFNCRSPRHRDVHRNFEGQLLCPGKKGATRTFLSSPPPPRPRPLDAYSAIILSRSSAAVILFKKYIYFLRVPHLLQEGMPAYCPCVFERES